jgi:hypothetical protein
MAEGESKDSQERKRIVQEHENGKRQEARLITEQVAFRQRKEEHVMRKAGEATKGVEEHGMKQQSEEMEVEEKPLVVGSVTVQVRLKLKMDLSMTGKEGSEKRKEFETKLTRDLANASGASRNCFHVKSISPGSAIVDVQVMSEASVR